MLEITNVSKTFNPGQITEKRALFNINLKIKDGDFITVIGGNGAGKSTLLNLIAGVHFCDTGKIILNGLDLTNMAEYKRAAFLGRVFQDPMMGTASNMQIEENLAMALRRGKVRSLAWGIKNKERSLYKERLSMLGLGLENRLASKVGLLSGGQRQALTLLMATLKKPELLLLDEHTAALDPKTAAKVLEITDKLVSENHLTTFMVTHNMKHAIDYGNRLIMMMNGNIVFDIAGEEKKKLKVEDLLEKFAQHGDLNDRVMLGQ